MIRQMCLFHRPGYIYGCESFEDFLATGIWDVKGSVQGDEVAVECEGRCVFCSVHPVLHIDIGHTTSTLVVACASNHVINQKTCACPETFSKEALV